MGRNILFITTEATPRRTRLRRRHDRALRCRGWCEGVLTPCGIHDDGSEGERYDLNGDALQWRNLRNDAQDRSINSDLIADLYDRLPPQRSPRLLVDAPA